MATAEAQKVLPGPEPKPGTQEMSAAAVHRLVDTIAGMLLQLPAPQRLEVLRQVEAKVKPLSIAKGEIVRKLSKTGGSSYTIALPASLADMSGTYGARIEEGRLILEPGGDDARIRKYGTRLRLMLPKRLVEALGFPNYVRIHIKDSRIVIEPA